MGGKRGLIRVGGSLSHAVAGIARSTGCNMLDWEDDVTDSRHCLKLTLDGKTGQRAVLLVPSAPYLNRWLGEHPDADGSDGAIPSSHATAA